MTKCWKCPRIKTWFGQEVTKYSGRTDRRPTPTIRMLRTKKEKVASPRLKEDTMTMATMRSELGNSCGFLFLSSIQQNFQVRYGAKLSNQNTSSKYQGFVHQTNSLRVSPWPVYFSDRTPQAEDQNLILSTTAQISRYERLICLTDRSFSLCCVSRILNNNMPLRRSLYLYLYL